MRSPFVGSPSPCPAHGMRFRLIVISAYARTALHRRHDGQPNVCPVAPVIVLVLGYPGTGKFTVAKELVTALSTGEGSVKLIDNHVAANVLFDLIAEADGRSVLPPEVVDNVREINLIIARTIDEVSPRDWSFVLTHHLRDNERNQLLRGPPTGHRGASWIDLSSCHSHVRTVGPGTAGHPAGATCS